MRLIITSNNSINQDGKSIEYRLQHPGTFQRMMITQFSIWNVFENINEYYKFLQISVNNGPAQLIQLTEGIYTASQLQSHLQQALQSILPGAAVSIQNNRFTIQAAQQFKFVKFGDYRDTLVCRYLGYQIDGVAFQQSQLQQIAQNYLNVSLSSGLHLNMISPHTQSDNKNIILSVPMIQATYSLESFQTSNNDMQLLFDSDGQHISRIHLQLLDDNLLPLKINQQFHINIIII